MIREEEKGRDIRKDRIRKDDKDIRIGNKMKDRIREEENSKYSKVKSLGLHLVR